MVLATAPAAAIPPLALTRRQQPRRDRAEQLIAASLDDADLAIAFLCRALQISRTTLCRLFAQDGGVQAYILGKRLEAVRDTLLAGPHDMGLNELARIWQFSDASHLTRRFKQRYGWPPKRYRLLHGASDHRVCTNSIAEKAEPAMSAISDAERVRLLEEENRVLKTMVGSAAFIPDLENQALRSKC